LAITLFISFGVPAIVLASIGLVGTLSVGPSGMSTLAERVLLLGGLSMAATNLPATLIVSEIILVQENSLFTFQQVIGGAPVTLFSPWPLFILFHLVAATLLFVACVRRVRRIEDE
jgi:hypothetical protein